MSAATQTVSKHHIVVVEDDLSTSESMKDVLEMSGYQVEIARNGLEAIDKLWSLATKPCVILLDLMMPKMNGWQFLDYQKTSQEFSNIPVIICSAIREDSANARTAGYFEKPLNMKSLIQAVETFCK